MINQVNFEGYLTRSWEYRGQVSITEKARRI
jgi:hypothetical protein